MRFLKNIFVLLYQYQERNNGVPTEHKSYGGLVYGQSSQNKWFQHCFTIYSWCITFKTMHYETKIQTLQPRGIQSSLWQNVRRIRSRVRVFRQSKGNKSKKPEQAKDLPYNFSQTQERLRHLIILFNLIIHFNEKQETTNSYPSSSSYGSTLQEFRDSLLPESEERRRGFNTFPK